MFHEPGHRGFCGSDVEVTLVADEPPDRDGEASQVWSVPPGGVGPDLRRLIRLRQRLPLLGKRR